MAKYGPFNTPREAQIELARKVIALRRGKELTQAGLAKRSGVAIADLCHFERTGNIEIVNLIKLTNALNRMPDLEYFLNPAISPVGYEKYIEEKTKYYYDNKLQRRGLVNDERIYRILQGLSFGDAFGAGVEFQDRDWIRANVNFTEFVNVRHTIPVDDKPADLFTKNYQTGDYTDDTEMTIGLIKALMEPRPPSRELLVRKWKAEYELGIAQKGFGRNGHGSMRWFYEGTHTIEQIRDFQRERSNPGNAPAMRAVPIGLLPERVINSYAAINARATHPHPHAIMSSQLVARAAQHYVTLEGRPADIFDFCLRKVPLDDDFRNYLSAVNALPAYDDLTETDFVTLCGPQPIAPPYFLAGIKGVPSDAKYTAGCILYVLRESNDAMDALRKSVRLGGDVDSVAAVTVGIMAGKYGLDSIPSDLLEQTEPILNQADLWIPRVCY